MIDLATLREKAPSVLRTAEEGAGGRTSEKYKFFTTKDIIDALVEMNWDLVQASQQKSKKRPETTKHMVRFRNKDFGVSGVGGNIPEVLLINSHDATTSLKLMIGVFRLVCSNGLIVPEHLLIQQSVRHYHVEFEDVKNSILTLVSNVPDVIQLINTMKEVMLAEDQKQELAMKAITARYPEYLDPKTELIHFEKIQKEFDIESLLTPIRREDQGEDLFTTFNILQEKLIRGDIWRKGETKERKARPISNILRNVTVNQRLWTLAHEYVK